MPHEITIETELGQIRRELRHANRTVFHGWKVDSKWMSATRILRYVDLYGGTVLNRLQCDDLVQELDELRQTIGEDITEELEELRDAAFYVARHPHTFLRFKGD